MSKKQRISKSAFLNAKLTSTISITLVLVLLGFTFLILFVGKGLSNYVKEKMSINVMLSEDITDAQINNLRQQLDGMPFVKSSRFISKEEAKEQLIKDLGEDPEELLGYNPAQDCIEIFLHSEYANSDSLQMISKKLKATTNISDLLYQQDVIDLINNNLSKITTILLILSAILLFISIALIRNTIRLSIYSKRFIINTMKLVGATGGFIRKPFVRSNALMGIFSGLLANSIIFVGLYYFNKEYGSLSSILNWADLSIVFGLVVALGIIITSTAAIFAVNRYLRMNTDNLFYI
jgi:cell division transport system permease protein